MDFIIHGNQSVRLFLVFTSFMICKQSNCQISDLVSWRHGSMPLLARVFVVKEWNEGKKEKCIRSERKNAMRWKIWCEKSSDDGTKSEILDNPDIAIVYSRWDEYEVPRTINSLTAVLSTRSNSMSKLEAQPECARRINMHAHIIGSSFEY